MIIEVKNLNKFYGSTHILKDISLEVPAGSVTGLLGPNGAGKTTLMKSLLDLIPLDGGEIKLGGILHTQDISRASVVYLPEKFTFYPYYTVEGALHFFGKMYGLGGEMLKARVARAAEVLKLSDILKQKIEGLSKGQMQRVGVAKMLLSDGDLLILDEPFSGLDPVGIKELKEILQNFKAAGKTILISSHILSEIEKMADSLAIMKMGELLYHGEVKDILQQAPSLEEFFYQLVTKVPEV